MHMIKILFFIEELRAGGAEKVLCNLVNSMDQTRFDITVQTLWPCDPTAFLKPGIRYRSCYPSNNATCHLLSRAEAALGLTYPLHIKGDYDIEVAYLECGPTKIMAGSTNRNAKKLAWVHCDLQKKMTDPQGFAKKAAKWYRAYDKVICVSQNVKDSFDELFGRAFDSTILYNTIDDAEILAKAQIHLPELPLKKRFTVVAVGRLSPEKGFMRLLKAQEVLLKAGSYFELWLVGDGPDRPALEQYIQERGLADYTHVSGYQKNPYPFITAGDLMVCPSYTEGLSTFITESLILGKPIVTTDCGGMTELLGNSQYGLITENTEPALQAGLQAMLQNPELRERYADMAKQRGADFTARSLCEKTEQFFCSLVKDTKEA